jgi:hypothetical protein
MLDKIFKNGENKYIIYSAIFAAIYFFFILPILSKQFSNSSIFLQFFIFNLGILIVLCIYIKSKSLNAKMDFTKALEYLLVVIAISVWIPDYHVNMLTGELIVGGVYGVSTSDYLAGYIATNILHLKGLFVVIFTYIITPIAILYLAKTVSKSNFVNRI